ncbi:glucuronate 4-epimerase [Seminavis robusta]|uniref:Glucuronate 4-epimerase n=1 Tax=Seminavis robusta TaxID=568900 RepID=A0A9N8H8Y8_9STRA|nr:glucuronate 4-epimerase [Seminavis robusta]|eukprot:Sro256_g100750.1 glucuronate 4-epimerase (932) ;mRNA; f:70660-73529
MANDKLPDVFLDESSVVLITGMAGFIGSELAMALHRVYAPKKIIGVDSMDDGFGNDQGRTAEELGVFDYKRQRLFHVLQTIGDRCHFYRVDFRPNIPEYQDRGEVPVLDHIFASHPDITHVVHLADPYGNPSLLEEGHDKTKLTTQAIPRKKEQIKAGMMEALLEQLRKAGKLHPKGSIPHFTYASSAHVYSHYNLETDDFAKNPNPPPFAEERPIVTPASIHGAAKLTDEILAKAYHETRGIYSAGLRFFEVYGPWSSPGTFLFDLAERAVRGGDFVTEEDLQILDTVTRDYVYIDDAVDAILAAMQFKPTTGNKDEPPPVVINVGTGKGTTVRTILQIMQRYLMSTVSSRLPPPSAVAAGKRKQSVSFASTQRTEELLGFKPQVTLEKGIFHLLAWHHDRAFPYGSLDEPTKNLPQHPMEKQGMVACSPFDVECLKGAPVFPCASECSHRHQCTKSFYDNVLGTTRAWTAPCEAVLYTVILDSDLTRIPSATVAVSTTSQSHVESDQGHCNLAFVSSNSPLVKNLQAQVEGMSGPLQHGFWSLVLVDVNEEENDYFLEFLPKLSPGLFFGGDTTKRIIYVDPDVIIESIPDLISEASMQPKYQADDDQKGGSSGDANKQGATAMLIGKGRQQSSRKGITPLREAIQDSAYRSVRIGVIDKMSPGDGFALPLDSSFIVHTLQSEDSRLFRCDVFGELIQWGVGTDQSAFEFILELHDMWSSVIVKKAGLEPWWVGEGVVTIPERPSFSHQIASSQTRRLLEALTDEGGAFASDAARKTGRGAQLVQVVGGGQGSAGNGVQETDAVDQKNPEGQDPRQPSANDESPNAKRDGIFGNDDHVAEPGPGDSVEVIAARNNEDRDDDAVVDDDANEEEDGDIHSRAEVQDKKRDVSAYDTWMGVLSSTSLQYFVRIVETGSEGGIGVVVLDDYDF